jgi:cytochrome c
MKIAPRSDNEDVNGGPRSFGERGGKNMRGLCLIVAGAMLALSANAHAGGDPTKGKAIFRQCQPCHSVDEGVNRVGPSLFHVVGRPAASLPAYTYSDAMTAFGAAGHTWDEATLTAFLQAPRDYLPGIRMAFAGLRKPDAIADIIAYLKDPPSAKSGW